MTTLIKHYARKACKNTGMQHWEMIFNDGALKTEKKIYTVDSIDSDLLWFTTSDAVAGGANNYLLQLTRSFAGMKIIPTKNMRNDLNKQLEESYFPENEFLCFCFDADEIGTVKWNQHKGPWIGASSERSEYVKIIDAKSNLNGDDTRDYWITEHDVDISKAKDLLFLSDSPIQCLNRYGFSDYYDFYVWFDNHRDKAIKLRMKESSPQFYTFIGKLLMKRDSLVQLKTAA